MKRFLSILISLLTAAGITLVPGDNGWYFREPRSFLILPLFILLIQALRYTAEIRERRMKICAAVPAVILAFCHVFGQVLTEKGTALWILQSGRTFLFSLLAWFSFFVLFYLLIFYGFRLFTRQASRPDPLRLNIPFAVLWLILVIAWLPWLLNQYPGVMTADTTDHIEMALGIDPLTNHHPVLYTFLIKAALKAGRMISRSESGQTGAVLFIICQFLVMTGVCAAVLRMILRTASNRAVQIGAVLFFVLYPVNPLYSVTMWKDVPFAAALLVLTALLAEELRTHQKRYCIGIALAGILLCLFRHNGFYMILLTVPFIPAAFRQHWKPVFAAFLAVILFSLCWDRLLLPALNIPEGSSAEALSVPLQQLALTAKRQHERMDEETLKDLESRFTDENIWKYYTYRISDPVKNRFNDEKYSKAPGDFWRFWFRIGCAYPQDYLDAFLLHTYGYWYPETPHWVFVTGIDDNGLFGIHMDPKLNSPRIETAVRWLSDAKYDGIPLLSLLFSPGACFWVYLTVFCYCLWRKSRAGFLFIPLFVLWLTALASPVNCEFRYIYGMFLCFPVLAAAVSGAGRTAQNKHSCSK